MNADRDISEAIQLRALRDFVSMLAGSEPRSRQIDLEGGVAGAIVPAAPERSIVNSVTYRDPGALASALPGLATAYEEAGVRAYTVWVPEHDHLAVRSLREAGHVFDGDPLAMLLDLAELREVEIGDLVWDTDVGFEVLGAVNDEAYGIDERGGIGAAFRRWPEGIDLRLYRAWVGGETACVLGTIDHQTAPGAAGPDCGVYFVAVPSRFRRRRLAIRLMAVALSEARERGCATSSLQSSALGEPMYLALGYRRSFRLQLYERRRAVERYG